MHLGSLSKIIKINKIISYTLEWSEIEQTNFFSQFQVARYAKRCQYINRTLCKNLRIFEKYLDLPFQLFILQ